MPATPAWPPKSTPRLFIEQPLAEGAAVYIDGAQAHYLIKVMRAQAGDAVKLFDDVTGEYLAITESVGKRDIVLNVKARLAEREAAPDLWLCQAPIKRDRFDWIAEKACELGIAQFWPVLTRRCIADKVKEARLRSHMIEAAEQCERTALPQIAPLTKLGDMLEAWPEGRTLFFCDERGGGDFTEAIAAHPGPAAVLIGPEGGFTDEENAMIRAHCAACPVSLGPRILRADTAAVCAISIWMAAATTSDWR